MDSFFHSNSIFVCKLVEEISYIWSEMEYSKRQDTGGVRLASLGPWISVVSSVVNLHPLHLLDGTYSFPYKLFYFFDG